MYDLSVMSRDARAISEVLLNTMPLDTAGNGINPDAYAQILTYNGDGTVATISFTDGTNTWTQTFTYTAGLLTGVSRWVKS